MPTGIMFSSQHHGDNSLLAEANERTVRVETETSRGGAQLSCRATMRTDIASASLSKGDIASREPGGAGTAQGEEDQSPAFNRGYICCLYMLQRSMSAIWVAISGIGAEDRARHQTETAL
jgi:hypothetical protein